ncbi:MAG: hypothetical protein SO045_06715 [Campylobacter sp.]|nr:hypothetical protein [Campylobacter sp.]
MSSPGLRFCVIPRLDRGISVLGNSKIPSLRGVSETSDEAISLGA